MNKSLVTIALSVFNLEDCVGNAIESVLKQSYPSWELIAIDDASSDGTFEVLKRYEGGNVRVFRNAVNRGTYWNRNLALLWARGEFFTTIDGDDQFFPHKLEAQVTALGSLNACLCAYQRRHPRYPEGRFIKEGHNTLLFRRSLVERIGYYDTVRFNADSEYVERIESIEPGQMIVKIPDVLVDYAVRPESLSEMAASGTASGSQGGKIREAHEEHYRAWHREAQHLYLGFPAIRRTFEPGAPEQAVERDPITVSVASFPEREESLRQMLDSVLPWADHINVFLNEYKEAPAWLKNAKIVTQIGEKDLGDRGKFWWADTVRGYHFVCDDDLLYSEAYVQLLLTKIEFYQREAVVSVHGSRLKDPNKDYYTSEGRELIFFHEDKLEDRRLDFLGTGTIAYHTDKIDLSLNDFSENNMADIFLGLKAKREGIPLVCCASPGNWVVKVPLTQNNAIYEDSLDGKSSKWNRRDRVNQLLINNWSKLNG